MDALLQDLRFALRTFAKNPAFSLVAVLTLGLGVGATTAIFSVVHCVLLRPLPYPEPDRIMRASQVGAEGRRMNVSDPNFFDLQEQSQSFAALAQFSSGVVSVVGGSEPVRVLATTASRDFFSVLGVQPRLGRGFLPDELQEGGSPAVIVSHGFWLRSLGGEPNLAGRTLTSQDRVHAVVGVMPPGFQYPAGTELWTPRELHPRLPSRTAHNWQVIGRLRNGVTLEQAQRELTAIAGRLKHQHGDDTWMVDASIVPLHEHLVGRVRPALMVLLGAAVFLLLITCGNVVNLLLARTASRQRELAVRVALGAGQRRIAQQLLAESLVLALLGGALGVVMAHWGVGALLAFEPGNLPRVDEIGVNPAVLGFALAVSLLSAMTLALFAVWRTTGRELRSSLAEGQRSPSGGAATQRLRGALVVGQFALTVMLLVGAGLLGRTLLRLISIDPGFRTTGGVTMNLALPPAGNEAERARLARFHDELLARLRAIPGVQHAAGINDFPLGGNYANGTFLILSRPDEVRTFDDWGHLARVPERTGYAEYRVASDGYFTTMGIPLLRGRLFEERDAPDAPHVAVISDSLARTRWPGEDALGKLLNFGNMDGDLRPLTVVGIVADIRERAIDAEPEPTIYAFHRQRPASTRTFTVVMHGSAEPAAMIGAARRILFELDPTLPPRFRTLEELFSRSLAERRFSLLLLGVFGGAALLLAVLGIYGMTSYTVAQRTREIGIRVALGAQRGNVLRMVLRSAIVLALLGVALGTTAAYAATGLLAHLLYDVSATDPATFAAAGLFLIAIALLASYLPARRAARVDPVIALRAE